MLAVTVTPGGSPALRELPSPTTPPGGILVRVRACGLCGSDVEKLRPGGVSAGTVLGHEIAGVVVDGALPAGLRVALAHHVPCGGCAQCLAGHEPLCPAFAASALEPGGFCELTAASSEHVAHAVLPLPDHVSDVAGSFVEPLACVLRGIERLSGDAALVAGAGSIGLLAAQALRARGAEVRVLEPEPARARRAAELGFGAPRDGERFDGALLSAAGAFADALPLLEPGGHLVLFSGGVVQPLDVDVVYRRELVVRGMRSSTPRHLREALTLIAEGAVDCESLVDCVLGLESFDDGLARYLRREALKVVFAP
jgi:L-iditol 2-dehydrogenase